MFKPKLVKIYKYKILPGAEDAYLRLQEKAQALYRESAEVEFTYLKDAKNPLLKTEVIEFFSPNAESEIKTIDSDPRVLKLFKSFEADVLDQTVPISEEILEGEHLSCTSKIHHIEIYCSSLKKSYEFWSWFLKKLGYQEFQKWDQGVSFKLGATYIVFVQAAAKHLDSTFHRCRPGLNHLAFHAPSREFVDVITNELKNREMEILYADKHPHAGGPKTYGVFFEDPERIKVELMCE